MPLKTGGPCAVCGTRESTLWHGKKKEPEKICCHNSECERQLGYLPPLQKQVKEKAAKKRAKAAVSEEQPVDPFEPTEEERVTPKLWMATLPQGQDRPPGTSTVLKTVDSLGSSALLVEH